MKIMISLLILLFLREVTGATFFHQYDTEVQTQICNASARGNKAAWWFGKDQSSLQTFERGCCNENGNPRRDSKNCDHEDCPEELHLASFRDGGILACKTLMEPSTSKNKTPVFNLKDDCQNFNFFIVAKINREEQTSKHPRMQSEENVSIEEGENFILSCEFELEKQTATFAVYWFKDTMPSMCLFSVSNEGLPTLHNFYSDVNCCIDDAFRDRRIKTTLPSGQRPEGQKQSHIITITNSTMADTGIYFCVVAAYTDKYRWSIESRISVSVGQSSPTILLKISLAVIPVAALLLIGGIICFLCWKKNVKGKPLECQERDQTTVAPEDCSPYAVSSSRDPDGNITVYSLATAPGETPSTGCFLPESKTTPGVQPGENVEAPYSQVLKDRTHLPMASDVGLSST